MTRFLWSPGVVCCNRGQCTGTASSTAAAICGERQPLLKWSSGPGERSVVEMTTWNAQEGLAVKNRNTLLYSLHYVDKLCSILAITSNWIKPPKNIKQIPFEQQQVFLTAVIITFYQLWPAPTETHLHFKIIFLFKRKYRLIQWIPSARSTKLK